MISKKTWIGLIMQALEALCDTATGFAEYENSQLYNCYNNFLSYAVIALYDDANFEDFVTTHMFEYRIGEESIKKLDVFSSVLNAFFEQANNLSDFEVIRRKEWEEIIPLAKECFDELKKIYDKEPEEA